MIAMIDWSRSLSLWGLALFFGVVVAIAVHHRKALFFSRQGWSHRIAGAALLTWLMIGVIQILHRMMMMEDAQQHSHSSWQWQWQHRWWYLWYDTILGILGITTTLTAARDFPHKYVQNAKGQSGSLSQKALVTQAEMIEHSFYQGLNLGQAWYLYYVTAGLSSTSTTFTWQPWVALFMVTSPWLIRGYFPVHSFSHNWKVTPAHQRTRQEVLLYQVKKSQYLFYKHVLLHGLNVSMILQSLAFPSSIGIGMDDSSAINNAINANTTSMMMTTTTSWRIYWLALNTSYVMEFFLQTLVRRHIVSIATMFGLQQLLMVVSSVAAMLILVQEQMVRPAICVVSLLLNFGNRHHEVVNVLVTAAIFYGLEAVVCGSSSIVN